MNASRLSSVWPVLERVAREAGVLRIGASDLEDAHRQLFAEWIDAGRQGTMHYLDRNRQARLDPRSRFPWARSVVVVLVPYAPERPQAPAGALSNHVARYAQGDDYHDVVDAILRRLEDGLREVDASIVTRRYVDTGPLSDRAYAAQGGLGWIGRNGMLIDPDHGSWVFIGTLLTSLENDIAAEEVADRCGSCTRCLEACPTAAILPNRTVESSRCLSYATIEHRGDLPHDLAHRLGENVFGCDICQEVCPWNAAPAEAHPAFAPREAYRSTPVSDLLRFGQSDFSSLFRKSAIKRAKLAGMVRNVKAVLTREDASTSS
jgi:epoxyqueuosine reductase